MTFSDIQGNADVRNALRHMVDTGRIPHAIMFHEDDGGGALPIVLAFLQYLYCRDRMDEDACGVCPECNRVSKLIHPDIHFIFPTLSPSVSDQYLGRWRELLHSDPCFTENELSSALGVEGKSLIIHVAEAKSLIDKLSLVSVEGGYRSVVIYLPEKMNVDAANKLLKLIEEPPAQTVLLFITHAPEAVLQTIQSRCQRIRVLPENLGPIYRGEASEQYAELFGNLALAVAAHNPLACIEAGEKIAELPSRQSIKAFCKFASSGLRDIFLYQQGLTDLERETSLDAAALASGLRKTFPRLAMESLDRASMLVSRNVNAKIVFTELALKWYKTNM